MVLTESLNMVSSCQTNLHISEAEFNELYPDLVGTYSWFNDPVPSSTSPEVFEQTYLRSKLWRLNNVYTIVGKTGEPVIFRMNYAQHKVYAASRKHPRVIILKSRQQGISTLWLVSYFDDTLFAPYLKIGLMAQGDAEAMTLLERTEFLWERLSDNIKGLLQIKMIKNNTKELSFNNHSSIFIRVSFRSTTLQRLHVSEFGKIANANPKRARETRTGTLQALAVGNTGVIESTAEGRNDFMVLWDAAVMSLKSGHMAPKDFYPVFLSWLDDPDCNSDVDQPHTKISKEYFEELERDHNIVATQSQVNFWIIQYRELGGDISQEYPATPEEAFRASRDGTYYSALFIANIVEKKRLIQRLYDRNLHVDVFFDLGVDDYTVVGFVQWYKGNYRLIDEYWNNGYGLGHYVDEIESRGYTIRNYYMPHDISVRELGNQDHAGRARSRLDTMREKFKDDNIQSHIRVMGKSSVIDGIDMVRRMIPKLSIDPKCSYLIDCFYKYTKEWDDKLKVWKKTPLHDEYSHGADMLRGIATTVVESTEYNNTIYETDKSSYYRRSDGFDI